MSPTGEYARVDLRASPRHPGVLERIGVHLRSGGLVAYPTETVYGFGCVLEPAALARLARLKERGEDAPFLLLTPDESSVEDLRWSPEARELAEVFWPGALTLVLEDPSGSYPSEVRGPTGGVAVRRTPHPVAGALVVALGAPLTSTSANPPGGEPATTADEAAEAARAVGATVDEMWILDGGRLPPSPPSTIVDLTGDDLRVIREGAVPARRLACARSKSRTSGSRSPGRGTP
ncbi:MAG: L-threonylcarbamoyladenylate synthase [Longimicrobiales bacterium]